MERLDFNEIAQAVRFKDLLDFLNIPYTDVKGELKGQGFIVNVEKNRYTNPTGKDYGNPINFMVAKKEMGWREAALFLKANFLDKKEKPGPELPNYELKYTEDVAKLGITAETAKALEIGIIKGKGYNSGKIGFTARDTNGTKVGYLVYDQKKNEWKPISQLKHNFVYNLNKIDPNTRVGMLFEDPINAATHFQTAPICVSMTRGTITETQLELIKQRFDHLMIVHHDPAQADYLVKKLSKHLFVLATSDNEENHALKIANLLAMSKN